MTKLRRKPTQVNRLIRERGLESTRRIVRSSRLHKPHRRADEAQFL
jgi:hypothetical protein